MSDMIFHLKTKYLDEPQAELFISKYEDGGAPYILFKSVHDEPLCVATVNIPELELADDDVCIKTWSENEGLLEEMIRLAIIEPPYRMVACGPYVHASICKILVGPNAVRV